MEGCTRECDTLDVCERKRRYTNEREQYWRSGEKPTAGLLLAAGALQAAAAWQGA